MSIPCQYPPTDADTSPVDKSLPEPHTGSLTALRARATSQHWKNNNCHWSPPDWDEQRKRDEGSKSKTKSAASGKKSKKEL